MNFKNWLQLINRDGHCSNVAGQVLLAMDTKLIEDKDKNGTHFFVWQHLIHHNCFNLLLTLPRTAWLRRWDCFDRSSTIAGFHTPPSSSFWTRRICSRRSCGRRRCRNTSRSTQVNGLSLLISTKAGLSCDTETISKTSDNQSPGCSVDTSPRWQFCCFKFHDQPNRLHFLASFVWS